MDILGQRDVTLRRFAAGSRGTDGRFAAGTSTDSTIVGSLQPADGDDLATLPDGERARGGRKLYTETLLRVVDLPTLVPADQIIADGIVYEVRSVGHEPAVLEHYKAILVELQEADQ